MKKDTRTRHGAFDSELEVSSGRGKRWAAMLALGLNLWGSGQVRGQNADWLIKSWQDHDGIPESSALAVAQTPDGYLWVGSPEGLLRFNGYGFVRAEKFTALIRLAKGVPFLETDRSGRLWAQGDGRLALYDHGVWRPFDGPNHEIRSVAEDMDGQILLGGTDGHLYTVADGKLESRPAPDGLKPSGVFCVTDARDGRIWLANKGYIGRLTPAGWSRLGPAEAIAKPLIAASARTGGLWVYVPGELRRYQADGTLTRYSAPDLDQPRELLEDHSGTIWIASITSGLRQFRPGGEVSAITTTNGLAHNAIRCLLEDREGSLWAGGSQNGLNQFKRRQFLTLGRADGLPDNFVRTIVETSPGHILVGTHGGGLARIQAGKAEAESSGAGDTTGQYVWSLLQDADGRLWIGTFNDGLFVREHGVKRPFPLPAALGKSVTAMMRDSQGGVWVGCSAGLCRIEGGAMTACFTNPALAGATVTSLAEDSQSGTLWVGTYAQGLFALDGKNHAHITKLNGLPGERISALTMDAKGYLWIGLFEHGLAVLHEGKTTLIGPQQGLPFDTVASMIDDGLGYFWLGTPHGLLRVPRAELHRLTQPPAPPAVFNLFNVSDGLGSEYCAEGYQPNALRDRAGRLWFGTDRGVVTVDPARLHCNPNPPSVKIEQVAFTDRSGSNHVILEPPAQTWVIPAGGEDLTFSFAGLSYVAPEKVQFKYRLGSSDNPWIPLGNRHELAFHELAPGRHVLQLTAANNDGVWNETGTTLVFTLQPFLWQTLWFRLLGLAAVGGAGSWVAGRSLRRRYQRRIDQLQRERDLEQERARLATVLENTSDLVVFADSQGKVIYVNPAGQQLIGVSAAEAVRALELAQLQPRWAADLVAREGIPAARRQGTWESETALLHRDGHEIPVSQVVIVHKDAAGRDHFVSTIARNITERTRVEAALRAREADFRAMFDVASIGMAQSNPQSRRWLRVNRKLSEITGYTPEELLRMAIVEVTHPEDRQKDEELFGQVVRGERPDYRLEKRYVRKDGQTIWVNVNMTLVRDDTGQPIRTMATVEDITERKRFELERQASRQRLKLATEAMSMGIWEWHVSAHQIQWDDQMFRLYGVTPTAGGLVDYSVWSGRVFPEDLPQQEQVLQETIRRAASSQREFRILRADNGECRWLQAIETVRTNANGQAEWVLGTNIDVTERKRAEAALQEREEIYSSIVNQAADAIALIDGATGRFVEFNPAAHEGLGYSREEFAGLRVADIQTEQSPEHILKNFEVIRQQGRLTFETRHRCRDGGLREVRLSARQTNLKGHNYIAAIWSDITEYRQMENRVRQGQKMEAIGTLAGGIAHDFNNILAAMSGYAYLLQQDVGDHPAAQESVAEILVAVNRAKELVRQILTFSRQREGSRQVIHLEVVVKEAMKFLRASLPAHIQIDLQLAANAPTVLADATQIYQVVLNLATNAMYAMGDRGGQLSLSLESFRPDSKFLAAHPEFQPLEYARLAVADTGHGMDAKTLERIFEPFFTTKPVGKGTGLGLSMVHGIIEAHHGLITVESRVGQGTTFALYFAAHQPDSARAQKAARPVPRGQGERILVVDDEPSLTGIVEKQLARLGYEVATTNRASEAVGWVREHPERFDLVITDMTMPEMNGVALAQQMRQVRPELPVILVSGYSGLLNEQAWRQAGIRELIDKPVAPDRLAEAVQRALTKR